MALFSIPYAQTKSAAYLERDSVDVHLLHDADIEIHEIPCVLPYEKETKYTVYGQTKNLGSELKESRQNLEGNEK